MIKIYSNLTDFVADIIDEVKLFILDTVVTTDDIGSADIVHICDYQQDNAVNTCTYLGHTYKSQTLILNSYGKLQKDRYLKRYAKLSVYHCMQEITHKQLPWGSLTGIRPTKLAYDIKQKEGSDYQQVFRDILCVSPEKIQLVSDILSEQMGFREQNDDKVDLYVGIPFCVSRCIYCSFTSGVIDKLKLQVEPYLDKLIEEIKFSLKLAKENGYEVSNIYIGGGTPTALTCKQLQRVIELFDPTCEFTVEAGRPDTIDEDKLRMLADHNVNRICINPQSFNDKTLSIIGRSHSVQDIYDKYNMTRNYPFLINMDLIAGLPNENLDDFVYSINETVKLSPHNITVHSLALKKGSTLKEQDGNVYDDGKVAQMIDYAQNTLYNANYRPYYLYRQKYVSDSLENVGYCQSGAQCIYNIDIMEETISIMACGCNAISKRVYNTQSRIERQANPKDVKTYIDSFDKYMQHKRALFERK
ncbi:MAG: coproporphyrinogen dehydrogenase HemZ [Clostridia bacterium]|nr:coproporphyrinogen dehydrogenase HemZ [Clostridia bacterium]